MTTVTRADRIEAAARAVSRLRGVGGLCPESARADEAMDALDAALALPPDPPLARETVMLVAEAVRDTCALAEEGPLREKTR